jgi:aminomethyltransferase
MVDFGGWDMPVHYGSQIEEHHAVRREAGVFDVSHMRVVDIAGADAANGLGYLLANDVGKLRQPGRALYTCMLRPDGGVLDDLIVYFRADGRYRLVVNAATADKDLAWLDEQAAERGFVMSIEPRMDLGMLAVQGPAARERVAGLLSDPDYVRTLRPFSGCELDGLFVARTGYTGEDGVEIVIPVEKAEAFWRQLLDSGVRPCGLGARDTLRLEAGMNLYGADMDETVTPLECGLGWTVSFGERDFVGREALLRQREHGPRQRQVGLILEGRGVLRGGQKVITSAGDGVVTSGTFSPTMERSIGLARIPASQSERCEVVIRNKVLPARCVAPPFVRNGRVHVALTDS